MLGRRLDSVTVSYGFAHFGKISFWYASEILFAYYLSEVCGLAPSRMALILASSFVLSAAADLLVGHVLRDTLNRIGPAVRLQMWGALASSATLMALFLGTYVAPDWRLAYGLLFAAVFRLGYVVLDLPQNVLLSLATSDAASRSRMASLRIFFSAAGALLVSASLLPLMSRQLALPVAARFVILSLVLAALAISSSLALKRAVEARAGAEAEPARMPAVAGHRRFCLRLNGAIWRNIALSFLIALTVSCFGKVAPYYSAYFLATAPWGMYVLPGASLGAALSQPAWAFLAARTSPTRLLGLGAATLALAAAAFNRDASQPAAAIGAAFFIGAGSSGMAMTLWAGFAGLVARQTGLSAALAYGALTASLKLALACGAVGIGAVLSVVDYRGRQAGALVELMSMPALAAALLIGVACCARGRGPASLLRKWSGAG